MINGKRTKSQIAQIFNSEYAILMLTDLEKLGYLIPAGTNQKLESNKTQVNALEDNFSKEHLSFY